MWGTLHHAGIESASARFIPTHVGNTRRSPFSSPAHTVHPHACGEHAGATGEAAAVPGSSPRMWGTLDCLYYFLFCYRFIPTHVGNTPRRAGCGFRTSVHPHACGEHVTWLRSSTSPLGSSPRMWGTLVSASVHAVRIRFIPTHVGNTAARSPGSLETSVHPHACGEHPGHPPDPVLVAGSSPRMWGTRPGCTASRGSRRFIPTHVGNTSRGGRCPRLRTVHPHACGEHGITVRCLRVRTGSSPRMWGTRCPWVLGFVSHRFIPTHVGNTSAAVKKLRRGSVHPHACGEHRNQGRGRRGGYGSSPRMWGTRKFAGQYGLRDRFIPTHVGNTSSGS